MSNGRRAWRLAGLSSALAFPLDLGARPLCRRLRGRGCANCQSLPQAELFVMQRERPGLHSQAVAWPPRRSAGRREAGSQRPCLGEAAPPPPTLFPYTTLFRSERAARAAELQLCAQARERRAPAERLLWPGRASPSASQLLAFIQRNPRADLLQNGLVGSPCSPRDSQDSSPAPQFKSINSSAFSLLHSPTLTSIHDHRKNHSLD